MVVKYTDSTRTQTKKNLSEDPKKSVASPFTLATTGFPALQASFGIFLPLITVNCTVLAVSLFMVLRDYSYAATLVFAFGSAVGWMLAIMIVAAINEKLKLIGDVPKGLQGMGIIMIIAGIIALAFLGFGGMVDIK